MAARLFMGALGAGAIAAAGCASDPFDRPLDDRPWSTQRVAGNAPTDGAPPSAYRPSSEPPGGGSLEPGSEAGDYVRYALFHSPEVEAAYQRWRAAGERLPQVSALPDPRLSVGFFLEEVETRVGPQQARLGVQQTFPAPGALSSRRDAAGRAARAAWRRFEAVRLEVTERVVTALHDLAYLDSAIRISRENLDLLRSFEEVVRARYRVGAGAHPELIRVQVELGQLEDRVTQLELMRPSYVARLNAAMNRPHDAPVAQVPPLPGAVATGEPGALVELARRSNPELLALDEQIEEHRSMAEAARAAGLPELTVGLDYIVTDEAMDSSIPESGDDPILLNFGITAPLWRGKYEAGVRESLARRLATTYERAGEANRLAAELHRAWFEHTDAHRRVRLYEQTLIPRAEESLRASLAGFRAGDTSFLDLLDTERTLLEFALAAERARADRGKWLATLNRLIGEEAPAQPAGAREPTEGGGAGADRGQNNEDTP